MKKSKKKVKKVVKKKIKGDWDNLKFKKYKMPKFKKAPVKKETSMALATISYNDIARPEIFDNKKDNRSLHLFKSHFPKTVVDFINMPTPRKYVLKRKGTGGKEFDYIPGWYAKKCANYAFGFNQSFEIKSREIVGLSAIVEGRFIVNDPKTGREILHKDDIGGHIIRFTQGKSHTPENAVDIANDYKSAATDAMKRCMSQIGFWKDVYGMNEAKSDNVNVRDQEPVGPRQNNDAPNQAPELKKGQVIGPDGYPTWVCKVCGDPVSEQEKEYSEKIYKGVLCREHQEMAKKK